MTAAASASKMTVPQLREELKSKGLDATGLKAELVARLEASRSGGDDAGTDADAAPTAAADDAETKGDEEKDAAAAAAAAAADDDDEDAPAGKRKRADAAETEDKDEEEVAAKAAKRDADAAAAAAPEADAADAEAAPDAAAAAAADVFWETDEATGKAFFELPCAGHEGRVIGRGGETIKYIENRFSVKLDMKRDRGVVRCAGAPASLPECRRIVTEVIDTGDIKDRPSADNFTLGGAAGMVAQLIAAAAANGTSALGGANDPDLPEHLKGSDPDETVVVDVPCPGQEGRVIGKGGATIKEIERQSGAGMKVEKGSGKCSIHGALARVIVARRAVMDAMNLVQDFSVAEAANAPPPGIQGGPTRAGDWTCPQCRGLVYSGKSNCFNCGAPRPMNAGVMAPAAGYAPAMQAGMMQQGGYAMQPMMMAPPHAMYGGAPAVNPMAAVGGGGPTTSIEVPCAGCEGRIIGKGGDMIKYLQSVTGAKLDMKRDVGTVMMTGSPEAVQAAQELVLEVMELGDTRSKGGLIPKFGGAAQQQQMMMVPMQGQGYAPAPGGYAMMPQQGAYAQPAQYAPQPVQYDPYSRAAQPGAAAAYGQQQQQPAEQGAVYQPQPAQHAAVAAAEWGQQQPAAAAAADAGAGAGAGAAGGATAAGEWQTHYSEGKPYYYNTVTGETRWA